MVKQKDGLFACEECGMQYKIQKIAEKCEDYCRENHACSLELIKHAVKLR